MPAIKMEVKHQESAFQGFQGVRLFTQYWRDETSPTRAVLIILHGLKDHSSRYSNMAVSLAERGFAVHAFDLRGHGQSEGKRAYVNRFENLITDLDIFAKIIRVDYPDTPVFLFGHSMGGTIATISVLNHIFDFKGVILSAAALVPEESISKNLIKTTQRLGNIFPGLPLMKLPNKSFSRDPRVVAEMSADPLIYRKNGPVRTAAQLLSAMQYVDMHMSEFSAPVLILHGTADKLSNPAGSKQLLASAKSSDKKLKLYEGLYHDLVHEPEKDRVIADITGWLEERAPRI